MTIRQWYSYFIVTPSKAKEASRPKFWPRPQRFGLGVEALASASNIWPQGEWAVFYVPADTV